MATSATAPTGSGTRLLRVKGMSMGKWLTTTPGRLRLASVVLVSASLIALIVTATATSARRDAANAVGLKAVPELVAAENLYGSLADADATASIIFLQAGLEDPALRLRYQNDITAAGTHLADVGREIGSSPEARRAVRAISQQLPLYTGYVETARANIRQGFPVGASYLRRASTLMRDQILAAATTLYDDAASRLDENYRDGTSSTQIVLVVAIGIVLLALLLGVQVLVTRYSNRILNVRLVVATIIVLVLVAWTLLRFVSAQDSLVRAQRNGSDSVQLLSAARILALQAQSDENLALSERGTGDAFLHDFDSVIGRLGGPQGQSELLGEARDVARRTGSVDRIDELGSRFTELLRLHKEIRVLDDDGRYHDAVVLATGKQAVAFRQFDTEIRDKISRAQHRLDSDAADARSGFSAIAIAIPVLLVLAGVLVLVGLQRRIAEYR